MTLLLNLIKLFHYLNDLFLGFYIFIFTTNKYDIYYSLYFLLIVLHWNFFKNECILSYLEKKISNKNYQLGDNPYYLPYRKNNKIFFYIIDFLKYLNLIIIMIRNINNSKILLINIINIIIHIMYKLNNFKKFFF